ncbi:uncharacterized protein LOC129777318 [Toxorhynchites rutilus septentrionalis]|uniref:uncharacterized protein LOC129767902 n=1 Tax=Toxorhynchites rutilus septentrionalis TaxID=329112 RepID=UPI002478E3B9|nr:uncharacterized protein LOC129767902 [Toxorhynchites rutilus septentrionalis]XP_055625684.1 uncharacterized protein LOC129768218 [Toxorhynchites rutilus septentrionalis]XP_055625686.1 uncharacterized protein LOC129768219 [Toxorhynchites rutilus septentrionalis]XP_055629245.1 uncharacterized protein LOC129770431 [Toxorhynchites rutilus septentrionalis]XP_055634809.1 uncharacterized protein LOC129774826 [Toxorhynchites rutilus septentrionalis]XP_055638536.1 uncharacterized protein LOC12977673
MAVKNADRQFILEFIEVYRSLPALWDIKCKDYTNRLKKIEQYDVLIEKYRENAPDADKQDVIKKINSLRTNFRKELKRIRDAEKSGAGAEEVEPTLWYFEQMRFLQNQETPTASISSMNPVLDSGHTYCEDAGIEVIDNINYGGASTEINTQLGPLKKRKKTGNITDELMELACKRLQKSPDDHDTIAAAWGVELKKMEPIQQMLAKKFINEILFEGQMGTLHRDSVVINNPPRSFTPVNVEYISSPSHQYLEVDEQNTKPHFVTFQ